MNIQGSWTNIRGNWHIAFAIAYGEASRIGKKHHVYAIPTRGGGWFYCAVRHPKPQRLGFRK